MARGRQGVDVGFCQGVKDYVKGGNHDGPGPRWGRVAVGEVEGRRVGGPVGVRTGGRVWEPEAGILEIEMAGVVVSLARARCEFGWVVQGRPLGERVKG